MALDTDVQETIQERKGFVVILAGSDSDAQHINAVSNALNTYDIPHQVRICSAHKQPEALMTIIREYDTFNAPIAYIAVAGGTDALSGTTSFQSVHPTISCPPDAPNQSCLTNPPGSSNAYIARAGNAARFIAQMWAHLPETGYKTKLQEETQKKITELEKADAKFSIYPYEPQEVKEC